MSLTDSAIFIDHSFCDIDRDFASWINDRRSARYAFRFHDEGKLGLSTTCKRSHVSLMDQIEAVIDSNFRRQTSKRLHLFGLPIAQYGGCERGR
jgi:hypothetical protein